MKLTRLGSTLSSVFALVVLAASTACSPSASDDARRPNLLLIVPDTLCADHLSLYGYHRETSPLLDAFAKRAIVFADAQSAAPWTAPALISLMTSLYPDAHGVQGFPNPGRLRDSATTLAEHLRAAGYATAAFTEGGYAKAEFGLGQGFDFYPANPGDEESHDSNLRFPSRIRGNVARALEWIRAHRDEPFFVFFQTYETHAPFAAPEPFVRRYRADYGVAAERAALARIVARWDAGESLTAADEARLVTHVFHCLLAELPPASRPGLRAEVLRRVETGDGAPGDYPREVRDFVTDLYDAEIAFMDRQLARLWQELETLGIADETLVVFVADHGEGLGERGLMGHGKALHEEVLRVPLLMRLPGGSPRSGRVDALVRAVDVLPTALEVLGVPFDSREVQGESLLPVIEGRAGDRTAISQGTSISGREDRSASVRTRAWRLVAEIGGGPARLYDRERDPAETTNVAGRFPDVAARLGGALDEQRRRDAAHRAKQGGAEPVELDDSIRDELEALGYLD